MHKAKVLADSVSPHGVRLTTFEVTIPRIVLAEFNTHRMFSRNSASSRAIPVEKMLKRVMEDPYIPSSWGKNQKGMQAESTFDEADDISFCQDNWLHARDSAVQQARRFLERGVHKQITNRLLEPFMWHTIIVTATEWSNFFHLRNNPMAHPDIQIPARMMQELYVSSGPERVDCGEWHLPMIGAEDYATAFEMGMNQGNSKALMELMIKVSISRCARVSYLTHDGKRDLQADLDLHDKLLTSGHMSPFEHVARPICDADYDDPTVPLMVSLANDHLVRDTWCGNFRGWVQYRKTIPGEHDMLAPPGP